MTKWDMRASNPDRHPGEGRDPFCFDTVGEALRPACAETTECDAM